MSKGVKVATLDKTFSEALRESYAHICQYPDCPECGNTSNSASDCSHYYGRRYRGGRWHPDNCIALCRGIHGYVDTHNAIQVDMMRRHLGDTRHDMLVERLHDNFNYTPYDRWEMNRHYKSELDRILALRVDGEQGYISLVSYD